MADADSEYKKGLKCVKTGLFKWKPDYAGAAIHFEAAAKAYEQARNPEGAANAYEKLAETNEFMNE
jgi:gamma-soluble NSF attachment protein